MQHLGAEDELRKVLRDIVVTLPLEDRLWGMSLEDRLRGLSPEDLERLRQLLDNQTSPDSSSRPESTP